MQALTVTNPWGRKELFLFFPWSFVFSGKEEQCWNQSNLPEQGFSVCFFGSGIVNIYSLDLAQGKV